MNTKIVMPRSVKAKLDFWINQPGDDEISGFGSVAVEAGVIRILDVIMLPQKDRSRAHSDLDPNDINKALYLLRNSPGVACRYHWHSHVNMPTFWSGPDRQLIHDQSIGGFLVASVFNKKGESRTALSIQDPCYVFQDDLPLTINDAVDEATKAAWLTEYKTMMVPKPVAQVGQRGHWDMSKLSKKERKRLKRLQQTQEATSAHIGWNDDGGYPDSWDLQYGNWDDRDDDDTLVIWMCMECQSYESFCRCETPHLVHADDFRPQIAAAPKGPPASANGYTGGVY